MSGWVFALTVFAIQIFTPTISSVSTFYRHSSSGRKLFGGYRIVPKTCVSTAKEGPKTGICMFNYECTHRGGKLIGSCVDGFLFGACCSLPESELLAIAALQNEDTNPSDISNNLYINTADHQDEIYPTSPSRTSPTTQRGGSSFATSSPHRTTGVFINNVYTVSDPSTLTPPTGISSKVTPEPKPILEQYLNNQHGGYIDNSGFISVEKYPGADTILLNPDGTVMQEDYDPETEFTVPDYHFSTLEAFQKSTPSKIQAVTDAPNMDLVTFTYVRHEDDRKTTPIPLITSTNDKMGSIITKLSTTLLKGPSTSHPDFSKFSTYGNKVTTASLFSKHPVSVSPPNPPPSTEDLVLVPTIEHKNNMKTARPKPTSQPTETDWNNFYDYKGSSKVPPNQNEDVLAGSDTTSINHIIGLLHDNDPKPEPEPIATEGVTKFPVPQDGLSTWVSIQNKPWKTTPQPGKKPGTSGVFNVQGPSLTVEGLESNVAPTVIVIPPPQELPTTAAPVSVPLITRYPINRPQIVTKRPQSQSTGFYLTQKPTPLIVTHTSDLSSPGEETFVNFPPVRNPDLNTSNINQLEKPTIVQSGVSGGGSNLPNGLITTLEVIDDPETNTIDPEEDYEDFTTPELVDEKVGDKVHTFVEKIVNSLAGNFQDLENVLFKNENATKITNENGIELNNVHIGESTDPPKIAIPETTTAKTTTVKPTTAAPAKISKKPSTKRPLTTPTTTTVSTTKRPIVQFGTTTKKPTPKPVKSPTTTTSIPTKKPATSTTTKKPPVTKKPITKKPKPSTTTTTTTTTSTTTKKPKTTTQAIEYDEVTEPSENEISTLFSQVSEEGGSLDFKRECGVRPLITKKNGRIVGGKGSEFGSYPWQVLVRESTWLGLFTKNKCGGVLITSKYVITAAHCQPGFLASLVAVFGEFDISGELESKRSLSKNVRRVIVHRQYDPATFENDLAVLELDSPVQYDVHIVPICMPKEGEDYVGRMATVTGWGRLKYGGGVPSVLQEVSVPLIENSVCQEMFQTAGHQKRILSSFLCAGYANGQKDSCEGDSGGPLMVEREDGHWTLLGTVSHGIKCAAPYLPGVYMRTSYYKPWLKSVTGVPT